ncbi:hypothetical protein [Streptomyces dysideae]|uniref:Uncharacterized protein n=1 Tax=Streptomyces dysideae TaxID=909626 RepID=A0A117RZY7_9ACTN|nr:hypothetical protein [Streptomyces dysideae]KUO18409.1 hypothetical protein AQJ91_25580 [Streptomyces dysideae]
MKAAFHLVDTATGEVVQELGRGWATKATRSRRHESKQVRTQVMQTQAQTTQDFVLAAGLVLGVLLPLVVMS